MALIPRTQRMQSGPSSRCTILASLVFLFASAPSVPAQQTAATTDSTLYRFARLQQSFQDLWTREWIRSESDRHAVLGAAEAAAKIYRTYNPDGTVTFSSHSQGLHHDSTVLTAYLPHSRAFATFCRLGFTPEGLSDSRYKDRQERVRWSLLWQERGYIGSAHTGFGVCPTWYLGPESLPPWDERITIDEALIPESRTSIRRARGLLLDSLKTALTTSPGNPWLTGQGIRLLHDQLEQAQALSLAHNCTGDSALCSLLLGFTYSINALPDSAESSYRAGLNALDDATRCAWSNIGYLMDSSFAGVYKSLSCADQDEINKLFWWLSDPLWSVGGNDRFTEDMSRRVLLELRSALVRDERFDWRAEVGSDARREMVLRYGWPSFIYWRGLDADSIRTDLLTRFPDTSGRPSQPNVPYVSYEYGPGRTHTAPASHVLFSPFIARASDWSLRATAGGDTVIHFELPNHVDAVFDEHAGSKYRENSLTAYYWTSGVYPEYARNILWWPVEHYVAPWDITAIPDGETAILRRQDSLILATAFAFDDATNSARGPSPDVRLILSHGPDSFRVSRGTSTTLVAPTVLTATLEPEPVMIGIEAFWPQFPMTAARTRWGVTPPMPLSAMSSADRAASEPLFIRVPESGTLPVHTDSVLPLLSHTRSFTSDAVGIYWETYGFAATDTVTVSVRVERYTAESAARRFASRLGLATNRNTPVQLRWRESGVEPGSRYIIDGKVPITGRALKLNLRTLAEGDYWVDVTVEAADGKSVTSRGSITVIRSD